MRFFPRATVRSVASKINRIRESWPCKLIRDLSLLSWIARIGLSAAASLGLHLINMSLHTAVLAGLGVFSLTMIWLIATEAPKRKARPKPNLQVVGIYIPRPAWLNQDVLAKFQPGRNLISVQVEISNVPQKNRKTRTADRVTAAVVATGSGKRYSPLVWLGERESAVTIRPNDTKSIVLAVADYGLMTAITYRPQWSFVANHRDDQGKFPFRYYDAGSLPQGCKLRLELTDAGGEVVGESGLVWGWDDENHVPTVALGP